jgi:D-alanyl-D-alanine carboxypeptidase
MTAANGRRYIFALYVNRVSMPSTDLEKAIDTVGGTLGEIASAIYATGP